MPFTAGIGQDTENFEERLVLYEEIYYWAIHGEIEELFNDTGKYIDLLEDAVFTQKELPYLEALADKVRKRIAGNPEKWDVFLATELDPEERDIFVSVNKTDFTEFLDQFENLLKEAGQTGKNVVFKSDNPISSGQQINVI